ncbi:MAG: prepilin peptidase [Lachnospiraceae bacterium]
MCIISEIIGACFMIGSAGMDMKWRAIPVGWLGMGSVGVVVFRLLSTGENQTLWWLGTAIGIVFIGISRMTDEGLGYGDSWMILLLGSFLGFWKLLSLLGIAFLLSGGMAALCIGKKKWNRKQALPFIPFLAVGYMMVL